MIGAARGVLLFVGAVLLQWWWNAHLAYWGAAPQFLLALTVLIAAHEGAVPAMLIGFFWGLWMDVSRADLFGASALILTVLGYVTGAARRQIDLRAPGPLAVTVFILTWVAFALHGVLGLIFNKSFQWAPWTAIVFTPFLNAVAILVASILAESRRDRR